MNEITISQPHPIIEYIIHFIHRWNIDLEQTKTNDDLATVLVDIVDDIEYDILRNRDRLFGHGGTDIPVWIIDVLKDMKITLRILSNSMYPSGKSHIKKPIINSNMFKNIKIRTENLLRNSLFQLQQGSFGPQNEHSYPITLKELL